MTKKTTKKAVNPAKKATAKKTAVKKAAKNTKTAVGACEGCKCNRTKKAKARA